MTEEECKVILALATKSLSAEDFLKQFRGSVDGQVLGAELLDEAVASKNPDHVECALLVGFTFGFAPDCFETLVALLSKDWHFSHEDIVSAIQELATSDAVPALYQATQWVPDYLGYDEARALAVKAIWALGGIEGKEADEVLRRLAASEEPILRAQAEAQIKRRAAT